MADAIYGESKLYQLHNRPALTVQTRRRIKAE